MRAARMLVKAKSPTARTSWEHLPSQTISLGNGIQVFPSGCPNSSERLLLSLLTHSGPKDSCFTQRLINRRESCSALQEQCNQFKHTVGFGFPSAICEKTDLLNDWLQQNAHSFSIYLHACMYID